MIIGKNTNIQPKNNFINNPNTQNNPMNQTKPMTNLNPTSQHTNIMNKQEMNDKAFSMLQDRLNKGLISIDEFNKMCSKLGKIK